MEAATAFVMAHPVLSALLLLTLAEALALAGEALTPSSPLEAARVLLLGLLLSTAPQPNNHTKEQQ